MIEKLLTGAGVTVLIGGLSAWLGKVWANRILQQDRIRYETQMQTLLDDLRTRSSKYLFVHRLQFEKEFEIYQGLWKELLRAARAAAEFRALKFGSGKTQDEKLRDLRQAINRFKDRVFDYRPFYSPRIYDLTNDLLKNLGKVHSNASDRCRTERREDETEELLNKINDVVPEICDAIRERVYPVSKQSAASEVP